MRNDKRIVSYTLMRVKEAERTGNLGPFIHDLELLERLLNELPEYEAPQVLDVFCGKEDPDDE